MQPQVSAVLGLGTQPPWREHSLCLLHCTEARSHGLQAQLGAPGIQVLAAAHTAEPKHPECDLGRPGLTSLAFGRHL